MRLMSLVIPIPDADEMTILKRSGSMNISVVGLGKLGAPLAGVLAGKGHTVIGVDVDLSVVDALNSGIAPIREPDLQEWISRGRQRLSATTNSSDAVLRTDTTFIVVPTPSKNDGTFSLRYVLAAAESIGAALSQKTSFHLVVLCSTVMPGSTEGVVLPALEASSGKRCGEDFGLCYNPEFIALGSVIRDMRNPDMVLIGESDAASGEVLATIHKSICDNNPRIAHMNFINAELTKLSVNTFVTTKISYANMLAEICEILPGADVEVVTSAIGADSRIGPKYLKGALGYGGPCFPRDNIALAALFRRNGLESMLGEATDRTNRRQVTRLLQAIMPHLPAGGTVAVLGLSYKPHTDVIENSQGLDLAEQLLARGIRVMVYDPAAMDNSRGTLKGKVVFAETSEACLRCADVVVITTPWPEFRQMSPEYLKRSSSRTTIFDCWRILPQHKFAAVADYRSIGVGPRANYEPRRYSEQLPVIAKGA
jgi:UDPglucose 6-dehydrogenase